MADKACFNKNNIKKGEVQGMDFLTKDFFGRYLEHRGRSTRKAYWLSQLFIFIALFVAMLINEVLYAVFVLVTFIPSIMIMIRRMHDAGKSAWHYWWCLTVIGVFWVFYILIKESDKGSNQYGEPSTIS